MARRTVAVPDEAAVLDESPGVLASFFQGLADPSRVKLVQFLLAGERTVTQCVEHVGLSQSRVSSHLGCLTRCGYVGVRREGRFAYYSVTDARVAGVVALAQSMVADHRADLKSCPVVGNGDAE